MSITQPTITRWRWRSRIPGGKWQRCLVAMTDEEAQRHAQSYAGVGFVPEMEKVPGSEQEDPAPIENPPLRTGWPGAPKA